ncbi:MAG: ChbG/HpnK family deacetylase [Pseudomonadota bacterium]
MFVIVNGDDFGLSRGINLGIARAHDRGVLASASLVAGGRAFDHAVELARDRPGLSLGVHLVLTDEAPLLPDAALVRGVPPGASLPGRNALFASLLAGRADFLAIRAEWRAQISRIAEAGIAPTHLDGHQFVHLFPGLFPVCLDLAREFSIPHVRRKVADPFSWGTGFPRLAQLAVLKGFIRGFVPRQPRAVPCVGFSRAGGRMTHRDLERLLSGLSRHPVVEVMLHPGLADEETRNLYGAWGYAWENDVNLATSLETRRVLAAAGRRPVGFGEVDMVEK